MPDYRRMYDDKEHLYAYDLDNREVTVQIEKVFAGELMGEKGRKSKKPMIKFVGKDKKLAVNKTNGKTISKMYGKNTDDWVERWITIYPTTTEFGGETVDCIRVKPGIPSGKPAGSARNGRNKQSGGAGTFDPDAESKAEIDKVERAYHEETARKKKAIEAVIGRSLDDDPNLTDDEVRAVKEAGLVENSNAAE